MPIPTTTEFWVNYAAGALMTSGLLFAWFHSNLAQHVWNAFRRHAHYPAETKDDLLVATLTLYPRFGELWICPLCLGTWVGLAVAAILVATGASGALLPLGALSWPAIYYSWSKLLEK